jgi:threonine/homoserine/homoserine lactone efflux protein
MIPDSIDQLLLVFTAYVVATASPGPSNLRIMGAAMHQGRRAGLLVAAGVVTGSIFWGALAAAGVAAILARYAEILVILKLLGGLYLLYLALKAARTAMTLDEPAARNLGRGPSSSIALYRQGLLMHLTNPKSVLGWIALVALGLGPEAAPGTVFIILAGCAILAVLVFGGYAVLFSTAPIVRAYKRARRWIEGVLATVFAIAGLRLLLVR